MLQLFEVQLERLKQSSLSGFAKNSKDLEAAQEGSNSTSAITRDLLFGSAQAGNGGTNGSNGNANAPGLEEEQKLRLEMIQKKDEEFDRMLEQIEQAVENAGEIAKRINEEATLQVKSLFCCYLRLVLLIVCRTECWMKWTRK